MLAEMEDDSKMYKISLLHCFLVEETWQIIKIKYKKVTPLSIRVFHFVTFD